MKLTELKLTPYPVIPSEGYAAVMEEQVEPYLAAHRQSVMLRRSKSPDLYGELYRPDEPCRGTVLISHGFTESCLKYHEAIAYFLQNHYAVVMAEYRGHGFSRSEPGGEQPTHVRRFHDYVNDLHHTVEHILLPHFPRPYFLYAHSMGGGIGATYLERHPDVFDRAILTAPMLEIDRGGMSKRAAKGLTGILCLLGRGKRFLPGQHPFSKTPDFEESSASSRARYDYYFARQCAIPELQNGGSSNRWAHTCLEACDELLKPKNCKKVTAPVLLFQAELDRLVLPGAQETFIRRIPRGTLVVVPESKHELYRAGDAILPLYWDAIFRFLRGEPLEMEK